jgi:hypothetical protein
MGDYPTAHRAWSQLTLEHGIHTRLTLTHFTAGAVFARDKNDPVAVARTVMANAANFDEMLDGPEPDTGPVLDPFNCCRSAATWLARACCFKPFERGTPSSHRSTLRSLPSRSRRR